MCHILFHFKRKKKKKVLTEIISDHNLSFAGRIMQQTDAGRNCGFPEAGSSMIRDSPAQECISPIFTTVTVMGFLFFNAQISFTASMPRIAGN
jgi:hypothetical protein